MDYIKIDAYILILCHMISNVKLSRYFISKVKNVFLTDTQIIQKTILKHQIEAATTWIMFQAWM